VNKPLKILAKPVRGKNTVKLSVQGGGILTTFVPCTFGTELEAAYNHFKKKLITGGFPVDVTKPNLFSAFYASRKKLPKVEEGQRVDGVIRVKKEPKPPPPPKEVDFEMNLVEPLVGWKSWNFPAEPSEESLLMSRSGFFWNPDEPTVAQCDRKCSKIPGEHHTCGIYASTEGRDSAEGYGTVLGQVLGWGRYVRGGEGWRSQYSYPKFFLLNQEQENLVESLKKYHVPIFMEKPVEIYEPRRDGYEYWEDSPDWNLGADQESDSGEEDY
jgi:hypothetical protein